MVESNTGWEDEYFSDLSIEPTVFTDWCEISLSSEEGQDLRGTLRFRKDSRSSEEMPCVTAKNQMEISPNSIKHRQECFQNSEDKPQESLAYHLGMMVVQKAATVVNNVADGGKRNRDVIKQLRSDLESVTQRHEELQKEFENSKQWIVYYEKLKGAMENQVVEISERFTEQNKSMQENLLKSEREVERCRREVHNASIVKKNMDTELKDARRAIEDLTFQVEEAHKQSLHPKLLSSSQSTQTLEERETPKEISLLNCNSTQKTVINNDACTNTPPLSNPPHQQNSTAVLRYKQRQLCDATKALQIAHARGDKLRQQLLTSAEAMKSQTYQMKTCRAALEAALNESYNLKQLLKEEKKKHQDAEMSLQEEVRKHQSTTTELEEQKSLVCKIKTDTTANENKLLQQHERMCIEVARTDRLLQENIIHRIVDELVSNATNAAFQTRLHRIFLDREKVLKNESRKNSDRLKLSDFTLVKLQKQVKLLEEQLKQKEEDLTQYKSQICALLKEADGQRAFEVETEKKERNLQKAISASEKKFSNLKERLEKVLNEKSVKISQICCQIKTLKSENLELKLSTNPKQDLKSFSTQTDLLGSDVSRMRRDVKAAGTNAQELSHHFQITKEENLKLRKELIQIKSELKENQVQFTQTKNVNQNLRSALESERQNLYQKEYFRSQAEDECNRLNWTCRKQYAELSRLQQENAQLRKSRSPGQTQYMDSKVGLSSQPVTDKVLAYQSEKVEHNREVLLAHVYEQGDANESRRSSLSRLDTIPESDEISAVSNNCKPMVQAKTEKTHIIGSTADEKNYALSSDSHEDDVDASTVSLTESSICDKTNLLTSSKTKQAHGLKTRSKEALKDVAEKVVPLFPIWRRDKAINSNLRGASTASTSYDSLLEVSGMKDDNNEFFSGFQSSLDAIAPRQIGIPMSDEAFQRLLNDSSTTDCHSHTEQSHDDGYSTSSNSVLDETQQQQYLIWENVEPADSRKVEPLCDSSQVSNTECESLSKTDNDEEDDRHYFVTYAGVTFDLANFSMARMREITSSCEATSTPEGVNAFFEFLAVQVAGLDQDPYWCKHHNLGRPDDWLSLKNCYL